MYYTQQELFDAVDELERARHTIQNCEKLAAVYSVLDHMFPGWNGEPEKEPVFAGYSGAPGKSGDIVGDYGESEFLRAISKMDEKEAWDLMDELMTTLSVINPRLYSSVLSKI